MKILAIEFSSPRRNVAIAEAPEHGPPPYAALMLAEVVASEQPTDSSHRLPGASLALVESALKEARLEREQIECLAIGVGPGSYAGIRGAIALGQGWQLGRGVKLLGISSAECLAAQAQEEGSVGRAAVLIDAQRGEFYLGRYELASSSHRAIEPLRLATLAEAQTCERAGELLVGPDVTKWFPSGRVLYPRAATLARLAAGRTDFVAGEELEPIYLRETAFVKAPPSRKVD